MARNAELAATIAVCDAASKPRGSSKVIYVRMFTTEDERLFLSIAPVSTEVAPIAAPLSLDMTIRDALQAIGPDGGRFLSWFFGSGD